MVVIRGNFGVYLSRNVTEGQESERQAMSLLMQFLVKPVALKVVIVLYKYWIPQTQGALYIMYVKV